MAAAVGLSLPVGAVSVALADPPYANCKEAHADGKSLMSPNRVAKLSTRDSTI